MLSRSLARELSRRSTKVERHVWSHVRTPTRSLTKRATKNTFQIQTVGTSNMNCLGKLTRTVKIVKTAEGASVIRLTENKREPTAKKPGRRSAKVRPRQNKHFARSLMWRNDGRVHISHSLRTLKALSVNSRRNAPSSDLGSPAFIDLSHHAPRLRGTTPAVVLVRAALCFQLGMPSKKERGDVGRPTTK